MFEPNSGGENTYLVHAICLLSMFILVANEVYKHF